MRSLPSALILIALVTAPAVHAGPAPDTLAARILASQQWGNRGLGFGLESEARLRERVAPAELPAVIRLLNDQNSRLRLGAQFALSAHCGAAIDAMLAAINDPEVGTPHLYAMDEALQSMTNGRRCSDIPGPRIDATRSALKARTDALIAAQQAQRHRQDEEDQRLQALGLKMLDPERRMEVSRTDCEKLVMRSAASMGKKPEQLADDPLLSRSLHQCANQPDHPR